MASEKKIEMRFFRAQGKRGGKMAWKNLSKEERSRIMTERNLKRWAKVRLSKQQVSGSS
jgi:hypothetical protein